MHVHCLWVQTNVIGYARPSIQFARQRLRCTYRTTIQRAHTATDWFPAPKHDHITGITLPLFPPAMAPPAASTTRAALHDLTERLATTLLLPHHHDQPASSSSPGPLLPLGQERRFAAALALVDDAIVAGGGPTGGWRAKEHGVFLRLWSEFRGEGARADDPVARVTGNLRLLDRAHVALRGRRCVTARG